VLFLDELGEFPQPVLEALRQPVESGSVAIARKGISITFPADIQLIAATNPCPCGFSGNAVKPYRCSPRAVERYRRKLSLSGESAYGVALWFGEDNTFTKNKLKDIASDGFLLTGDNNLLEKNHFNKIGGQDVIDLGLGNDVR
jgi:hypothetical protein